MGSYCPSEDDIRSVIVFCPDVDPEAVRRDLQYVTQSVEATVNRILDGNLTSDNSIISKESLAVRRSQDTAVIHPTFSTDSDDDLPYIPASKKKKKGIASSTSIVTVSNSNSLSPSQSSYSGECLPSTSISKSQDVPETVSLSSDSEDSVSYLKIDKDVESESSLSERLKQYKTSSNSAFISSGSNYFKHVNARKLKSANSHTISDSDSDSLPDLPEVSQLPLSDHQAFSYSSPSYDYASATLSQSSSVPNHHLNSQLSSLGSTVSTYDDIQDMQETVSSVTTMDSQYSDEDQSEHSEEKKKKRTPAEVVEQKRLAQQKKQTRERELSVKRKQKELEKAEKKAALEARKCLKPGECLKYVAVKFDSNVVQSTVGPVLLKLLQEAGIQYEVCDQPIPACISWTRKVINHEVQGHTLQQQTKYVDEQHGILIVPVQDFVGCTHRMSLPEFAWQASASLCDRKLSLIVQGMEKYFKDLKTIGQRQYKEAVRSTDPAYNAKKKQKGIDISIVISRFDMEQAMLELQLSPAGCSVSLVETPEDVAKIIFRHTKSVAEAPFKKEKNQVGFSFLPDSTSCVKIEKNGSGLLKCWKQQLCQFNALSPEVANAIVGEYPSPRLLIQAYEQCHSQREAERLLVDVRVRRGAGVLETSRRVGKEMSRRIYELFTGRDPDSVIN
ncbi:crossover junction endonuclease EME1-like isoform X2 [Lineus longissimus]|uniref:crossover junction endonuclease EME1-like isoform X2 n=1 Tax=Lineus longissimus TaxID=88925 RepID=UPI00315D6B24